MISSNRSASHIARRFLCRSPWLPQALLWLACLALGGCATVPRFAPANLNSPGWKLLQGQAVWRRSKSAPELAGELLLATNVDERAFVQFSKGSLPFLGAQSTPGAWQVEVPTQNQRFSGHGRPPARLIFLYLPLALEGKPLPARWSWQMTADENWRLEDRSTGQSISGFFTQ